MNYVVMDEIDNSMDNRVVYSKKNNPNLKKIILIISIIFLIIVFGYIVINIFDSSVNYKDIENQLVQSAKKYVTNNYLNTKNGLYITIDRLSDVNIDDRCSSLSGVLVEGDSYYPHLVCEGYKSQIFNNKEEYAKLNGDEIVILNSANEYFDLGCSSTYNVEVITNYINREGVYTYLYNIKNNNTLLEVIKRKVIVIDSGDKDIYPNIQLNGDEIVYLSIGDVYQEQGVTVIDKKDGDISSLVNITSNVNYNVVGEYEIKYTVTNTSGYSANTTRRVIIGEKSSAGEIVVNSINFPIGQTNGDVSIVMMINGDNYKHTVLPNGTLVTNTLIEFEVQENDIYNFLIYDKNDNITTKQVEINNIDKNLPTGVCNAITYKGYTEVTINNVSENSCIYSYEASSYNSVYMSETNYRIPVGELETVSVNIKDLAGNINKINCTVNKEQSLINKEYISDKGYYCIEPYTCFKQWDYTSDKYCYYSETTCGPINKRGCSITSVATILSKWDKRSSNGEPFNPYTLLTEVYNKVCNQQCSGDTTSKKVFEKLGLQVVGNSYYDLNMANYDLLLEHLKTGNPALIRVGTGWYTDGKGHLMALLTATDEGLVYLSDPNRKSGQKNEFGHAVNTFVPLTDIIKGCGSSCWFQMVKQ